MEDESIFLKIKEPEVMYVNAHGMMIKGYEPSGLDRRGIPTFRYVEVFLSWIDPKTKISFFELLPLSQKNA